MDTADDVFWTTTGQLTEMNQLGALFLRLPQMVPRARIPTNDGRLMIIRSTMVMRKGEGRESHKVRILDLKPKRAILNAGHLDALMLTFLLGLMKITRR